MDYFAQLLIQGVTLGSIYGLIAIGYTMVYGIVGMINFAHGEVFMIGAFLSLIATLVLLAASITWIPLALFLALIASMVLTAAWGWTIERIAYRPLRSSFRLAPLITAIGVSITLQNFVQLAQGARNKTLPALRGGFESSRWRDAELHADPHHGGDGGADGGVLAHHLAHRARARAAGLRAGRQDGGAVRGEC